MDLLDEGFAPTDSQDGCPVGLVDDDTICFRAAAATDGKQYSIGKKSFKYKADIIKYCVDNKLPIEEIQEDFFPEPLSHALSVVKGAIKGIQIEMSRRYPNGYKLEFFHTHKKNFRDDIFPDYKANRIGKRKPHWLNDCKQYVAKYYDEFTEEGLEADDLLGIRSYELYEQGIESVIITNDKDLKTIPGWNYDWVKGIWTRSTVEEAMKFFYAQTIAGDETDGIPGVMGLGINNKGTGKAQKIIQKASEEFYERNPEGDQRSHEQLLHRTAFDCWLEGGPGKRGSYGCQSLEEIENLYTRSARCLFILHKRGEYWSDPCDGSNF